MRASEAHVFTDGVNEACGLKIPSTTATTRGVVDRSTMNVSTFACWRTCGPDAIWIRGEARAGAFVRGGATQAQRNPGQESTDEQQPRLHVTED